jgi:hypothetical protein
LVIVHTLEVGFAVHGIGCQTAVLLGSFGHALQKSPGSAGRPGPASAQCNFTLTLVAVFAPRFRTRTYALFNCPVRGFSCVRASKTAEVVGVG